jgi:hypothetical protein
MPTSIPRSLWSHFQEYDPQALDLQQDANLIIQRTLEFGDWDDLRWLFRSYGKPRIRQFVRQYGERWLSPVTFNYWRKFLGIRRWRSSPLPTPKGDVWPY